MNATDLLKTVPLGALIAFSDGAPRPPDRFKKKLSAWKNTNGQGLLIQKQASDNYASGYSGEASFTLRVGEYGGNGIIVMRVNTTMGESSKLDFTVVELPTGTVRITGSGEFIPPQDLRERSRYGGDPDALQRGESEHPAGYGAAYPSPILPHDEPVLDLPGVKTFIRHRSLLDTSGASLIVMRDDGYHVRFPGTFCTAIVGTLDGMLDDRARRLLLALLKKREDGSSLTTEDLTTVTVS